MWKEAIAANLADQSSARTAFVREVRSQNLSMLSEDALKTVHLLAGACDGAILEIGAYIGGATVTVLDALKGKQNLFVTFEEPVEHPSHPQLPTRNSVEDLRRNISRLGLARSNHYIIPGASFESWALGEAHHRLIGQKVGLLVWDADACFDRDLVLLSPFLAEGCLLMVDDYLSDNHKSWRLNTVIDRLVADGVVESFAVLPWATWFGRLKRPLTSSETEKFRSEWRALASDGHVYYRRLLDYQERMADGPPAPLTFEDRKAFWLSAVEWAERKH